MRAVELAVRVWALLLCGASASACSELFVRVDRELYPIDSGSSAQCGDTRCATGEACIAGRCQTWRELGSSGSAGGVSAHGSLARCHRLAVDPLGVSPTVAWTDASAGREDVYLRTWTGTEWVGLGGSGAPGGVTQGSGEPAAGSFTCAGGVALGGDSRPWLLWQHAQPNDGLVAYLRHWTGAGWEELGGSASGGGLVLAATQSWWPALALGPSSRPAVALENAGAIYFITWTGTQWSGLGGSDVAPGISSQAPGIRARLALDGAGTPTVVWTTGSAGQEAVHARRWTGTAWELLGPTSAISRPGVPSVDPVVGVDSSGAPVAVWTELPSVGRGEVLARRWDGAAWNTLGPGTLTEAGLAGATTRSAALAFRRGALVVAWEQEVAAQTDVHCAQWDGTRWSVLDPGPGGVSNSGRARWPSLAADSAGALYLSWEEQRSPSVAEVYLRVLAP